MKLTVAYHSGLAIVPNKQDTEFKMQAVLSLCGSAATQKAGAKERRVLSLQKYDIIRGTEQPHTHFVAFNHLDDL